LILNCVLLDDTIPTPCQQRKNDGNTLLFSTVSDYVGVNADFDAVAPVTKINMILVASKKSKIKTVTDIVQQEQQNPGKLTWAYIIVC
jgi:tripartite-type tricarboxylate transporter receptor subunit TctC